MTPDGPPTVERTTGPEPASVTASRQLAAESRDRPRRVPPGPLGAGGSARRTRGTEASRRTIRLGRARPAGDAARDGSAHEGVEPCPGSGDGDAPPGA